MINHLWQSTVFAAAAGLLTLLSRRNRAQVRYWLWLTASVKFLVPFSLLIGLGGHWTPLATKLATPAVSIAIEQVAEPFSGAVSLSPLPFRRDWEPAAILAVWACGVAGIGTIRFRGWRRIRAAVRASAPVEIPAPVEIRSAPGLLEPGVVGLFRAVLFVPEGIADRLTPRQLDAVIAHELSHIRRRDNLTSAIHMLVEAVFWFHPLVWWIGARLVEEGERACDEAVLGMGGEPHVYAEAILNVCKLYVESPLACVSGVTGADLKKRIETIMGHRMGLRLNVAKKVALGVVGMAAVAMPIVVGMMNPPRLRAQAPPAFEVASIKRDLSGEPGGMFTLVPACHLERMTLRDLVIFAYRVHNFQVTGGPGWIDSERYNIEAKSERPPAVNQEYVTLQSRRLQTLLRDRFNLTIRRETKELPVYELTVAKRGPKLQTPNCLQREPGDFTVAPGKDCGLIGGSMASGRLQASSTTMANLARFLSSMLSCTVVDKTGITGEFDLRLTFTPDRPTVPPPDAAGLHPADGAGAANLGPDFFTALQEQLGLKLESAKGPVEILVIDRVERPSEN